MTMKSVKRNCASRRRPLSQTMLFSLWMSSVLISSMRLHPSSQAVLVAQATSRNPIPAVRPQDAPPTPRRLRYHARASRSRQSASSGSSAPGRGLQSNRPTHNSMPSWTYEAGWVPEENANEINCEIFRNLRQLPPFCVDVDEDVGNMLQRGNGTATELITAAPTQAPSIEVVHARNRVSVRWSVGIRHHNNLTPTKARVLIDLAVDVYVHFLMRYLDKRVKLVYFHEEEEKESEEEEEQQQNAENDFKEEDYDSDDDDYLGLLTDENSDLEDSIDDDMVLNSGTGDQPNGNRMLRRRSQHSISKSKHDETFQLDELLKRKPRGHTNDDQTNNNQESEEDGLVALLWYEGTNATLHETYDEWLQLRIDWNVFWFSSGRPMTDMRSLRAVEEACQNVLNTTMTAGKYWRYLLREARTRRRQQGSDFLHHLALDKEDWYLQPDEPFIGAVVKYGEEYMFDPDPLPPPYATQASSHDGLRKRPFQYTAGLETKWSLREWLGLVWFVGTVILTTTLTVAAASRQQQQVTRETWGYMTEAGVGDLLEVGWSYQQEEPSGQVFLKVYRKTEANSAAPS